LLAEWPKMVAFLSSLSLPPISFSQWAY